MPYWRLFYHLVWSTARRGWALDDAAVATIERSIRTTCHDRGAVLHAVGVMPDHGHVAVSIPPSIAVATFVGRLKGAASHAVNALDGRSPGDTFSWQAEYGALSFGEKALPDVVAYITNQHARHATDRLWDALEQAADRPQPASAGLSGSARGL